MDQQNNVHVVRPGNISSAEPEAVPYLPRQYSWIL
jgi:hypothetical protein